MISKKRFGAEERRLMYLVPASSTTVSCFWIYLVLPSNISYKTVIYLLVQEFVTFNFILFINTAFIWWFIKDSSDVDSRVPGQPSNFFPIFFIIYSFNNLFQYLFRPHACSIWLLLNISFNFWLIIWNPCLPVYININMILFYLLIYNITAFHSIFYIMSFIFILSIIYFNIYLGLMPALAGCY